MWGHLFSTYTKFKRTFVYWGLDKFVFRKILHTRVVDDHMINTLISCERFSMKNDYVEVRLCSSFGVSVLKLVAY